MVAKLGPNVRSVQPAERWLEEALSKAHDTERALDLALQSAPADSHAHSLRMARALASSLADELEGILAASGATSEMRLRTERRALA